VQQTPSNEEMLQGNSNKKGLPKSGSLLYLLLMTGLETLERGKEKAKKTIFFYF
jgi:hypothetical protein